MVCPELLHEVKHYFPVSVASLTPAFKETLGYFFAPRLRKVPRGIAGHERVSLEPQRSILGVRGERNNFDWSQKLDRQNLDHQHAE